ncbi:xylulokinase [Erwinia sp. E602]|uniref:xylulokinase n=1 Tax=unclassified Erwinia TaxID=2622719 RepID=UPI0006FED864|nr:MULTISPECIES: xylulokinase [unclassified Erwinia]KQN54813.1 xylulose kinase [Erwinia sp. Leaf53]PLV57747.1 xylulose kinase [Erwinia sp. B116]QUG74676.1 xylulokinase [Erwinia sp. E602]
MALYAGIDCGTQGTKVVIVDGDTGTLLGEGSAAHQLIADASGRREQQADWWIEALISAFHQAVAAAGVAAADIVALGVSGQQHGFVPLDEQGKVLHNVKLWCDTETDAENQQLIAALGGVPAALAQLGLLPATGYTASKILWFRQHHPEKWAQLHSVLLPHDYLNFWLTGERVAEYGDASGTGLLDVRSRQWDRRTVELIDDSGRLWNALPPLLSAGQCIGTLRPEAAAALGLSPATRVATGGGDNMMSAIGSGTIAPGVVTLSLGTSGTLFAWSPEPLASPSAEVAGFCSSDNGWLPLICTMNVTSATSTVQTLLQEDIAGFNRLLEQAAPGAGGVEMLPFFNGERVPPLPHARASLHNLGSDNFTRANLVRAVVESATYGLRYGIELFRQQGITVSEIRLTGGGSRSAAWRQIVADVMGCPVICLQVGEAAALGGAIQAMWMTALADEHTPPFSPLLARLCQRFVALDPATRTEPDAARQAEYDTLYQRYLQRLQQSYPEVQP